jgi:hypothetical protein
MADSEELADIYRAQARVSLLISFVCQLFSIPLNNAL